MKKIALAVLLATSATAAAAAEPVNFVHGQYTFRDTVSGQSQDPNRNGVNFTVGRMIGNGLTVDLGSQLRNENGGQGSGDTTRLESGLTYQYSLDKDYTLYTRGAIGYKLTEADDTTYWSVEPGVRAQVTDKIALNLGYRFRTAFQDAVLDQTNTVRVGAEYAMSKTQVVTLGLDRSYGDLEFMGVNVGYAVKF